MNRRVKIPLLYDGFFSFAVVRQTNKIIRSIYYSIVCCYCQIDKEDKKNIDKLSLGVSILPLTLFIIRRLKIGMIAPWTYIIFAVYALIIVAGFVFASFFHSFTRLLYPLFSNDM